METSIALSHLAEMNKNLMKKLDKVEKERDYFKRSAADSLRRKDEMGNKKPFTRPKANPKDDTKEEVGCS